ncbi:MAG TPA: rod-binding protein [Micavibrio sp.]
MEALNTTSSLIQNFRTPRTADVPAAKIDPSQIKNYDQIVAKAKEFEAVFITEMMKPMFESVDVDPLFGGGNGEDIYRGMMTQEYGKKIAEHKSLGLADYVTSALIRAQEESKHGQ